VHRVIAAVFMGLETDYADEWVAWLNRMHLSIRDLDDAAQATAEFTAHIDELVARRKSAPTDDFISRLLAAEIDGHRLSDQEVRAFSIVNPMLELQYC
jgi:cytochrome P450